MKTLRTAQKLLLALFVIPTLAFAGTCDEKLFDSETVALANEAAALFAEAEKELATDMQFHGNALRVIDLDLADSLLLMAGRIEKAPGDNAEYAALFKELSEVLAGTKGVGLYSRRASVGYRRSGQVRPDSPLRNWTKLENKNKYQILQGNWYLEKKGYFPGVFDNGLVAPEKIGDLAKELSLNLIGAGIFTKAPHRSTDQVTVSDFKYMALSTSFGKPITYKIVGYKVILNSSGEERMVIQNISRARFNEENWYYKDLAGISRLKSVTVILRKGIAGSRNALYIPNGILYKSQYKYQVAPDQLEDFLSELSEDDLEKSDSSEDHFIVDADYDGQWLRFVIKKDENDPHRLILISIRSGPASEEPLDDL